MKKINLIRHGETEGNRLHRYIGSTEEPLSSQGKIQLEQRLYPDAEYLYVSPMLRCLQTARLIYPKLYAQEKMTVIPDFRECDFGLFENKNYKELAGCREYQHWIDSNGTLPFPGGESPKEFKKRSCQAFEAVLDQVFTQGSEQIALVVHGGTIMSIMERFAVPHHGYYHWQVKNGCGYPVMADQDLWEKRQLYYKGEQGILG